MYRGPWDLPFAALFQGTIATQDRYWWGTLPPPLLVLADAVLSGDLEGPQFSLEEPADTMDAIEAQLRASNRHCVVEWLISSVIEDILDDAWRSIIVWEKYTPVRTPQEALQLAQRLIDGETIAFNLCIQAAERASNVGNAPEPVAHAAMAASSALKAATYAPGAMVFAFQHAAESKGVRCPPFLQLSPTRQVSSPLKTDISSILSAAATPKASPLSICMEDQALAALLGSGGFLTRSGFELCFLISAAVGEVDLWPASLLLI
jgi:hypothetical protein